MQLRDERHRILTEVYHKKKLILDYKDAAVGNYAILRMISNGSWSYYKKKNNRKQSSDSEEDNMSYHFEQIWDHSDNSGVNLRIYFQFMQ